MTDIVCPEKRSQMMAGIKGKNTKPELLIRKGLHKAGFRFRLFSKDLPGKPDIVLKKYNAIIFINGCFWHGHDCHLFKWPKSRVEFWKNKITETRKRDIRNLGLLSDNKWRVLVIWECSLKGKQKHPLEKVIKFSTKWLKSDTPYASISGADIKEEDFGARIIGT